MEDFVIFMGCWWILITSVFVSTIVLSMALNRLYRKLLAAHDLYELSQAVREYEKKKAEVAE